VNKERKVNLKKKMDITVSRVGIALDTKQKRRNEKLTSLPAERWPTVGPNSTCALQRPKRLGWGKEQKKIQECHRPGFDRAKTIGFHSPGRGEDPCLSGQPCPSPLNG